jgi:hypothetical protein
MLPILFSDAQLLAPIRILLHLGLAFALFAFIVVGMSFEVFPRVNYGARMPLASHVRLLGAGSEFLVFRCMVLLFFCTKYVTSPALLPLLSLSS